MVDSFWKGKRVLVTGGYGFLGKYLIKQLQEKGCSTLFAPKRKDYDLRSLTQCEAMLHDAGEVNVLFHLAANVGGIGYNQNGPYNLFFDNAVMGINLIHSAIHHSVDKFVQIGTACSYPERCQAPFSESDLWNGRPEPTNAAYGVAKRALLAQLQAAKRQYGLNSIYVIPANLYGPGDNFSDDKSHVIPALIKKIINAKDAVEVWGSGNASRDFLYVEDAARGIIYAAEKYDSSQPINLGSNRETTIAALVNIIKSIVGSDAKTIWQVDKPDGQMERLLNISRAHEFLDWYPAMELKDGLKKTVEWYKENYAES